VVLYGAAKLDLVSRFGQMGPLRSVRQVAPSFLDAPFGEWWEAHRQKQSAGREVSKWDRTTVIRAGE
jgi:hypothetical protein